MRKRNNQITLWLSDDELKKLNRIVEKLPYSRQRYIREAILGADIYMSPPAEYGEIVRELRIIGSNVHQLLLKAIQIKFIDEVMVSDLYIPAISWFPYVCRCSGTLRWNNSFVRRVSSVLRAVPI